MAKRRRAWVRPAQLCWCCRLPRGRAAIVAEAGERRLAWVCQVCAADEALVREFSVRLVAAHPDEALVFRRLRFVNKTVFEQVFAAYPRDAAGGAIAMQKHR
ncbi:MAG: hypothetical protein ACTHMJ_01960 [Thermomicrobiales bacterium]